MADPTRAGKWSRTAFAVIACIGAVSCTEPVGPRASSDPQLLLPPSFATVPIAQSGESSTGIPILALPDQIGASLITTTMSAINESNWVVGSAAAFQSVTRAVLWRGGAMEVIPNPLSAANMFALALNDHGMVVGEWRSGSGSVAFRWQEPEGSRTFSALPSLWGEPRARGVDNEGTVMIRYIRTSPCGVGPTLQDVTVIVVPPYTALANVTTLQGPECENELFGTAIDGGVIVGRLSTRLSPGVTTRGSFRWNKAVGNPAVITGDWSPQALAGSYSAGLTLDSRAVRSSAGGVLEDLGTLGGATSIARGINDLGWVVGESLTAEGETHAFVWTPTDGMVDLGTLGGTFSTAADINNQGYIVGDALTEAGRRVPVIWIYDPSAAENEAPEIAPITSQTAIVGQELVVTPVVTPEGVPFSLEWSGDIPANAVINGIFSFTPTSDQVGNSYTITVTATHDNDPSLLDSEQFVVSVVAAPVPSADFQVVLAPVAAQQPYVGDAVAYVATVHNAGPDAAVARLAVELAHREQAEWGAIQPGAVINGIFTMDLGEVAPGATVNVGFEAIWNAFGTHALTATITGDHDELESTDNVDVHEQVIDLAFDTPGVQTGGYDVPGSNTVSGEGIAIVGIRIPGSLIAGNPDWDLFLPAALTPRNQLPGNQLLQGAAFTPGSQFIPTGDAISGLDVPSDVGVAPPEPVAFIPEPDSWLAGRIFIPAVNEWNPAGQLLFARGSTNLRINDRANNTMSLERGAGPGLAVHAAGGATNAVLGMCAGNYSARMRGGDGAEFACGSLTTTVLTGEVNIVLADGTRVDVPAGATAIITERDGGYDVTAQGGSVTVTTAAGTVVVQDGETVFIAPQADTPDAMLAALISAVQQLVANGDLSADAASGLLDKLNEVGKDLAANRSRPATNKLNAFTKEVASLVKDRRITSDHGQALIDAAVSLMAKI